MTLVMEQHHLLLLKQFVSAIKANPDLLHESSLDFFRDFLEELGAKIPPKKSPEKGGAEAEHKTEAKEPEPEPMEVWAVFTPNY
ncbi:unnamed protein product [Strongylus vulgaris]|uniref:Hsp70-interacting protein N-terminal domain-containing protein n=1 Tax=Strongylus vulgaris TaxID=40348 RepID=A0A3P7J3G6_STRVU|nr:unnamed protein product [Strongylus vulgaris]